MALTITRLSLSITLSLILIFTLQKTSEGQNCKFREFMGDKYDKCASVCQGQSYKCIADNTCLCEQCPNSGDNSFVNTFDDVVCEFSQECTRRCMEANSDPDHGNIGRGKKCEFTDDYYGSHSSVCVCTCL